MVVVEVGECGKAGSGPGKVVARVRGGWGGGKGKEVVTRSGGRGCGA